MQGDKVTIWVATMRTEHTRSVSYGTTPEEALTVLVRTWVEKYCGPTGKMGVIGPFAD